MDVRILNRQSRDTFNYDCKPTLKSELDTRNHARDCVTFNSLKIVTVSYKKYCKFICYFKTAPYIIASFLSLQIFSNIRSLCHIQVWNYSEVTVWVLQYL